MARIRSLKPEFWTDGNIVRLSFPARLLFQGSWNFALCDQGHLPDDALGLKLKVLPADDVDAEALLEEIISNGRIVRKQTPDGRSYLHIRRLSDHQKVDARWASRCPYCAIESGTDPEASAPPPKKPRESPAASPKLAGVSASHTETPRNSAQDGIGGDGIGESVSRRVRELEALDWLIKTYGLTDDEAVSVWEIARSRAKGGVVDFPLPFLKAMVAKGDKADLARIVERVQLASRAAEMPPEPESEQHDPVLYAIPDPVIESDPGDPQMPALSRDEAMATAHASTCKTPRCPRCEGIADRWPDLRRSGT